MTPIKLGCVLVLAPPGPLTVSDTVFAPAVPYWCTTVVPVALVTPPSPNCQNRFVIEPLDASVNVTVSGDVPLVGAALKAATGG